MVWEFWALFAGLEAGGVWVLLRADRIGGEFWGLGFRVLGVGLWVQGSGFRVLTCKYDQFMGCCVVRQLMHNTPMSLQKHKHEDT